MTEAVISAKIDSILQEMRQIICFITIIANGKIVTDRTFASLK
jgi:hypothetical protein